LSDNLTSSIVLKAVGNLEKLSGKELYGNRRIILKYSGHFNNYNANVKYSSSMMQFNLSSNWKNIDEDIQIGLIEHLLVKIFKLKGIKTDNMKLYEAYMKGLSKYARKHTHDPQLEESFHRVNEKFFNGTMEKPNLVFANESFHKLGSYEYATDTVKMSTIFQDLTEESDKVHLDYVMYHELLHKKHTFNVKNGRHQAHTTAFRNDERKFGENAEAELTQWLRRKKYANKSFLSKIMDF